MSEWATDRGTIERRGPSVGDGFNVATFEQLFGAVKIERRQSRQKVRDIGDEHHG